MLLLRSILFNLAFYVITLVMMLVFWPFALLLPREKAQSILSAWGRVFLFLLRVLAGIRIEVRGHENIPEDGALVAMKHQSAWETIALLPFFRDPTYILKKELQRIPLFGWYTKKMRMISVDRKKGAAALTAMARDARDAAKEGRQILIFPEGTRRPAGAPPAYKNGVVHLYRNSKCKVVPVAHNAGLYWPRHSFFLYPGKVIVEFLPPIAPGMGKKEFFDRLVSDIEEASDRLIEEARLAPHPSPILETVEANRTQV